MEFRKFSSKGYAYGTDGKISQFNFKIDNCLDQKEKDVTNFNFKDTQFD